MASYNKEKLLALLRRKHSHDVAMRDVRARAQDAQDDVARLRNAARTAAYGLRPDLQDQVEAWLRLPFADAVARERSDVEGLVNWATWQELLLARSRFERLQRDLERLGTESTQQFGIVPELLHEVRKWGFRNPELEM